ncbi:MAG TPA: prohibitin family protein [Blastocatellia bacterium]
MVKKARSWFQSWWKRSALTVTILALVALFLVGYCWPQMVHTIRSGEAGVLWKRFGGGTALDTVYTEGTALIAPWDRLYIYNVRLQNVDHKTRIRSMDGLEVELDISIRYRLVERAIAHLHKDIGPEYVNAIIIPELESAAREVVAHFRADELYSTRSQEFQKDISAIGARHVYDNYFLIDDILIRSVNLSPEAQAAVHQKLEAQQLAMGTGHISQPEKERGSARMVEAGGSGRLPEDGAARLSESPWRQEGNAASGEQAKSASSRISNPERGSPRANLGNH